MFSTHRGVEGTSLLVARSSLCKNCFLFMAVKGEHRCVKMLRYFEYRYACSPRRGVAPRVPAAFIHTKVLALDPVRVCLMHQRFSSAFSFCSCLYLDPTLGFAVDHFAAHLCKYFASAGRTWVHALAVCTKEHPDAEG
jgi:hypothetical protein